jgi:hypothetical protein
MEGCTCWRWGLEAFLPFTPSQWRGSALFRWSVMGGRWHYYPAALMGRTPTTWPSHHCRAWCSAPSLGPYCLKDFSTLLVAAALSVSASSGHFLGQCPGGGSCQERHRHRHGLRHHLDIGHAGPIRGVSALNQLRQSLTIAALSMPQCILFRRCGWRPVDCKEAELSLYHIWQLT